MFGPFVRHGDKRGQSKLITFIDDASRLCCHGEFFVTENTDTLIQALRSALYKRGVPEAMYVDNGSIYASKEIGQICTRLGCLLCHTPVRDGAAKGKVERLFCTVRSSFLTRALDLTSIEALNRAFTAWVEDDYNGREHSVLQMRPVDRFGLDLSRVVSCLLAMPTTNSSSSKRSAPSSPTIPFPSRTPGTKPRATSAQEKSSPL